MGHLPIPFCVPGLPSSETFCILLMGIIEARSVKENQAEASEFRTTRNRIDDYRQRFFGARGCAVPDCCDILNQGNVNELGTAQRFNEWVSVVLLLGSPCFFQPRLAHNASKIIRKGELSDEVDTHGKAISCLLLISLTGTG